MIYGLQLQSKKGKLMTKEQTWELLEIYRQLQVANTMIAYGNAFEELHIFIEENCFATQEEKGE